MKDDVAETLMAAYAAGDRRALSPLFDRLAPRLLGFFERCGDDPGAAEDQLAATFVQLHRVRHSYRPGMSVQRWVFGIAARVQTGERGGLAGRKSLRRARPLPRTDVATDRDLQARKAIEGLPNTARQVLHLHRFERMSFEEIAEVLGRTEASVRCEVLRAYRELHQQLSAGDDGEGP